MLWPRSVFELLAVRSSRSDWLELHTRQAFWFGVLGLLAVTLALLWPVLLSVALGSVAATLWIYAIALVQDVGLFVLLLVLAIRYSRRAARGEMFEIPIAGALTRRVGTKR
ncbi:MAG: hypothetical protein JOZ38_11720 [Candidatus Eremiobacteraeota bacterium]|nr:hypothetical protein [Candidatus Eremiobacteraeota bacterium]